MNAGDRFYIKNTSFYYVLKAPPVKIHKSIPYVRHNRHPAPTVRGIKFKNYTHLISLKYTHLISQKYTHLICLKYTHSYP